LPFKLGQVGVVVVVIVAAIRNRKPFESFTGERWGRRVGREWLDAAVSAAALATRMTKHPLADLGDPSG